MPDADGNFKGVYVPAEAWERVFGKRGPQGTTQTELDGLRNFAESMLGDLEERVRARQEREGELFDREPPTFDELCPPGVTYPCQVCNVDGRRVDRIGEMCEVCTAESREWLA